MHMSERGLGLIRKFEGLRLHAYADAARVWTIGYGHTGPDVHAGMEIEPERAEQLLQADAARFEKGVAAIAGACTQGQFDALVSFAFNIGLGALKSSTLLRKHRAGDHRGAAAEFGRWVHSGGRTLQGLVLRRAAEAELYRS